MDRRFLTVRDVAEALQISTRLVYRLVEAGELPHLRLGSRPKAPIRIDPADLDALRIDAA